jgi:hypothetical protein
MNDRALPSERRLDRRIPFGSRATIRLEHGECVEAECVELSVGGMTLRAGYVPGESEVVTVEIPAPAGGLERPPLVVRVQVKRCHQVRQGWYEIGAEIVHIVG